MSGRLLCIGGKGEAWRVYILYSTVEAVDGDGWPSSEGQKGSEVGRIKSGYERENVGCELIKLVIQRQSVSNE